MLRNQALNRRLSAMTRSGAAMICCRKRLLSGSRADPLRLTGAENRTGCARCPSRYPAANSYQTLTADHLVCAVPFTVQRDIEVSPAFSVEKQRALSNCRIYRPPRSSCSRSGGSGSATAQRLRHHRSTIGHVWDVTHRQPAERCPAGFSAQLHSRRVTQMTEAERITYALEQVG